ncbi:hypothetical protein OA958_01050 [Bacteroidota bacterium]|nr:hypothetical protein [Bacteroidota bacterium]
MKKLLFLLMFPIICFSQKKKTAFISYFVPISKDVKKKYYVFNRNVDYYKYCSRIADNKYSLTNNSSILNSDSKKILFNNIFNKAKNGELVVYQYNDGLDFYGPAPEGNWIGEKKISNKNEIKQAISYEKSRDSIDNEGFTFYDDNGDNIFIYFLDECKIDDFIGIKFYEEWTFDYKNLTIDKKILYYAPAIKAINPITLELVGLRCPFIVENKNLKTKQIIATDFYTNTDIFCNRETNDSWFKDNLEPSVKFPFIKEAMTNENNSFYECSPPYNKKISNVEALSIEAFRDSISDDDEPVFDKNGEEIKIKFLEYYLQDEINSLGFIENWFFDDRTSSFSKDVSGISLEVLNYEGESEPIFLLKK